MRPKKITIIHSGGEPDYLFGLVQGLAQTEDLHIDVIDSDRTVHLFHELKNVTHLNFKGKVSDNLNPFSMLFKGFKYYFRLITYTITTQSKIFHIQWFSRNQKFERMVILPIFLLFGKQIIFTAHNVNRDERDNRDTIVNRITLKFSYKLMKHIIVHNELMKEILVRDYSILPNKISVINHGINISVPRTGMSKNKARQLLDIGNTKKVLLFFGNLAFYKGLDILINSFKNLLAEDCDYYLLIAGKGKRDEISFMREIISSLDKFGIQSNIHSRIEFIPDSDIEQYFMAADCIVLPYRNIYQSGVLFLAFRFGLPAILSDIGNFKETIILDKTGYVFQPENNDELSSTIKKYFNSEMYKNLEATREFIIKFAFDNYSWDAISQKTSNLYNKILCE